MKLKRYAGKLWFCILLYTVVSISATVASTVSIQLLQMDQIHSDVTESSLIVEESIIDYLFNQGLIVCTSPVIISTDGTNPGYTLALNDARSGSVDYLIFVTVYFDTKDSLSPDAVILSNINSAQWQIIRVSDNKQIASGKHSPRILSETDDSSAGITSFGKQIGAAVKSGLPQR